MAFDKPLKHISVLMLSCVVLVGGVAEGFGKSRNDNEQSKRLHDRAPPATRQFPQLSGFGDVVSPGAVGLELASVDFTRTDLAEAGRAGLVREASYGHRSFPAIAVVPQAGLISGLPWTSVMAALAGLVIGLGASLFVMRRQQRRMGVPIRRMLDATSPEAGGAALENDLPGALGHLENAFDDMAVRLKAQGVTLDQACELAGLGVWTILPDRKSVRASRHIQVLLGLPEEGGVVQLDDLRERIVSDDREVFDAALERAVEEARMTDVEFRATDAAGDVRAFYARTGPDGAVAGDTEGAISGILQDITDLRNKETALARSQKLERLAGKLANVGAWRYEVETRMFTGTRETAKRVGIEGDWNFPIEEAMDRLLAGKDRARMERSFWTCVGTGAAFDEVAKYRRYDGKETWLRVTGEAERDAAGTIVAVHGATQDVDELVTATIAAEEVRGLLQTILDGLSGGFVIHDRDGTIHYMNRRAHSILGVAELELVGENIWRDIPLAAESRLEQMVTEAVATSQCQSFEEAIPTPRHCVKVTVHPTSAGVAIYLYDVTEERETNARLRLLDAAVAQVSDVVLITEAKNVDMPGPRVVFANDAFTTMSGYSLDEILSATPRLLQGPETERERLDEIRSAIVAQRPIRTEVTNYRKDGTPFTTEMDITPLFNSAGECTHFVSIQRNTTRRRATESCLRAREEQFRLASLASQDIIWDWDMQTGVIWNSDNSGTIFGKISEWHVEHIMEGRIENVLERIHPDDRLKITESLDAALTGDAEAWRSEYRIKAQDGSWRTLADKAFIVRDEDGTPRRMVGAMTDVTDLRALDARLHQAQKLETVGHLTGGIAHDFNNLLTIILGNCDILLDDMGEGSSLRPLLQSIEDAAERGARVSSDLLAFSRRQTLEMRPTDVNALIRRSASLFERAADASIELLYDLTDAPMIAHVDPDKLEAALLNLVVNAVAAIEQGGQITLRTRYKTVEDSDHENHPGPGNYIRIDVSDDGCGMAPEVVERAFEPFFTTKEPGVGTGMGLSSVYGFVKQSGGHARIKSEQGEGTTVILSFPESREPAAATPPKPPTVQSRETGQRILLVEDDADLLAFVHTALSRSGYRIVEAVNGAKALELLEQDGDFDLLFTDIVMPGGVNGVQLARKAQELHPDLKVLFTSGYARDALPKERHVPSNIPMLFKPFRTNELMAKVEDALAGEANPEA